MSQDTHDTPEDDEPTLETPDLSQISSIALARELKSRFPEAFALCAEGDEDGNRAFQIRMFDGSLSRVEGMLSRALRIAERQSDSLDKPIFG